MSDAKSLIHSTAVIHPSAVLADNVTVGAYSIIGEHVTIGEGTVIGPHAVIQGPTTIGKHNQVFHFTSIGAEPQDKKFGGESTILEIGDHNIFREFMTINRGTVQDGGITKVGNHNLFLAYSHIGHDCIIHDHVVLSNYVGLAGHVEVEDWAILSGYAAVHQFSFIGAHAFIGHSCKVAQDVLPYLMIAGGETPKPYGLNTVGLRRRGFDDNALSGLKKAYRIIFRQDLAADQAVIELTALQQEYSEVNLFIEGIKKSTRGFLR